ncbi:MAG TPA: hypothetical protein VF260_00785 [Bacilli bacterium]
MNKPLQNRANRLQQAGLFIAGIIIGGALFMALYQHQFNTIVLQNKTLLAENTDLQGKLADLQQYKRSGSVVKSVEIIVEEEEDNRLDDISKVEVKNRVKQDLSIFKGQPISQLPGRIRIARHTFHNKIYANILEKDYAVDIKMAFLIQTELRFYIAVQEVREN